MKKRFALLFVLCAACMVQAAPHFRAHSMIELGAGGGWSTLGSGAGSYGVDAHVGYAYFPNRNVGLGLGLDCSHYGSITRVNGSVQDQALKDSEGEAYILRTTINSSKDMQDVLLLEVPFSLYFRAPVANDKVWFSGVVGAKVGLPVYSYAHYNADITYSGIYSDWNLELQDVPGHGFYDESVNETYKLKTQTSYAAFARLGVEMALDKSKRYFLYGHVYGTWYFTSVYKDARALPLQVGLEVGIRFRLPHAVRTHCLCN